MPVSRGVQLYSRTVAVLCVLAIFSSSVFAQSGTSQPASAQASVQTPAAGSSPNGPTPQYDYSKPAPMWSYKSYAGRTVPAPVLGNTPRIEQMVRNGVLYLSLNDAIALALENNLDIAIARYNLNIADTDILRTKAGSATRGVNTGVVSGTVGGTGTGVSSASGSGAGGTSTGTGGAGAGTSGIVSSTSGVGPNVDSFDPVLTAGGQIEHSNSPSSSPFSGSALLRQNTGTANFGYQQGWASGTLMSFTFNNNRQTTNSQFTTLSPLLNSNMRVSLRQHLLQGFGLENNRRFIIQAKNNKQISNSSFKAQIISTVSQIQNIYWDLVNAYEDMKVKERSLEFANRTLSDNRKQVEIGTLAPIEIVRAQSQVATSTQDLIVSQTNLQYQQLLMKNAITRNLSDNTLAAAPVIPTDAMTVNNETLPAIEELVSTALHNSPDIEQSMIDLKNREMTRRTARNAMKPSLDLVGFYGGSSLAGNINPLAICGPGNNSSFCIPAGSAPNTGYSDSLGDLFGGNAPDKGVALSLTIPIRNRSAQADQVRSELEYRQAQMRLQQLQNTIGISVRNAAYAVQQNRARIAAAQAARDLALQSLDAEQKKYALGASTSYLVLQNSRDEAQAESNLVSAMAAYEKSRVALDQVLAATLEKNGIVLQEAVVGSVSAVPKVPGVVGATDATIQSTQQVQEQMKQTPDQQIQQLQEQMKQPSGLPTQNPNPQQPPK